MRQSEWLKNVGFSQNPFKYCKAEKEYKKDIDTNSIENIDTKIYLPIYFVQPPDFDELFSLRNIVVYGIPGSGKTACKCMLDYHCAPGRDLENIVSVTYNIGQIYNDIEKMLTSGRDNLSDADIARMHAKAICKDAITALIERIYQSSHWENINDKTVYLERFLINLKIFLKEFFHGSLQPKEIMEKLAILVRQADFEGVFILLDDVEKFRGKQLLDRFQILLTPLIDDRNRYSLSNTKGVYFKFFFTVEIRNMLKNQSNLDIIKSIELTWSHEMLLRILKTRLSKMSQEKRTVIDSLGSVSASPLANIIDKEIVRHSETPRDLILIGRELKPRESEGLTRQDLERALKNRSPSSRYDKISNPFEKEKFLPTFGAVMDEKYNIIGSGFVLSFKNRYFFLTCAHVIEEVVKRKKSIGQETENEALRLEAVKGTEIVVQLASQGGQKINCTVEYYRAIVEKDRTEWTADEDIAILSVNNINKVMFSEFLYLSEEEKVNFKNLDLHCYGYTKRTEGRGDWFKVEKVDIKIGHGFRKVYQPKGVKLNIGKGLSGAPLFYEDGELIGMIQSINPQVSCDAFCIPNQKIYNAIQSVLEEENK
jgi:hypothetical protein